LGGSVDVYVAGLVVDALVRKLEGLVARLELVSVVKDDVGDGPPLGVVGELENPLGISVGDAGDVPIEERGADVVGVGVGVDLVSDGVVGGVAYGVEEVSADGLRSVCVSLLLSST